MTAINVILQRDRAIVATDSAAYDSSTGEVLAFVSKSVAVPRLSAAIATRGPSLAVSLFAYLFAIEFTSFDDMVERIESKIENIHDRLMPSLGDEGEACDIIIAGWSRERARPESYLVRTTDQVFGMTPDEVRAAVAAGAFLPDPYRLMALPSRTFGPDVSGFEHVDTARMDQAELDAFMRQVLERQRRDLFRAASGEEFSIVGGHVSMAVITADTITQRIIHRWDDRVGERIEVGLEAGSKLEPVCTGGTNAPMSRLRAEMLQRKAAKARRHG